MGLMPALTVPPVIILLAFIFIQSGSVGTSPYSLCINNPNSPTCSQGGGTTISCPGLPNLNPPLGNPPCNITSQLGGLNLGNAPYCTLTAQIFGPNPPAPAFCSQTLGLDNGQIFLPAGTNIVVPTTNLSSTSTSSITLFFTSIVYSSYGFVAMIIIAIAVIAIAGLTVFGSSPTSTESAHIIFIGGLMVAVWIILSIAEGFVLGNSSSMLTQMNSLTVDGLAGQFGTGIYLILSFTYTLGIIGAVSRGGI